MTTKSSGFSLIELLVVIAIIGILSAAGTLTYSGYVEGAKKNSAENTVQQIALAQSEEYANTGSYYITGATDTCDASPASSEGIEDNYLMGKILLQIILALKCVLLEMLLVLQFQLNKTVLLV